MGVISVVEFKWIKGDKPKDIGDYLISVKEAESLFITATDFFDGKEWMYYKEEEIVAYAPYPRPYKTRK